MKSVGQNSLCIEEYEMGQSLVEIVKSDFNGDGIEDILLFEYSYATHGTLGFGSVIFSHTSIIRNAHIRR